MSDEERDIQEEAANTRCLTEVARAFQNARARRVAAESIEAETLDSLIDVARDQAISWRRIERLADVPLSVLMRRALVDALGKDEAPSVHYDEDEWIAAKDAAWRHTGRCHDDRAPWRVEDGDNGERVLSRLSIGIASAKQPGDDDRASSPEELEPEDSHYEPLKGVSEAEFNILLSEGADNPKYPRLVRRIARGVLRKLHPGMPRHGIILDAAIEGVTKDVMGALVLIGVAMPADSDPEWMDDLRTRASRGYYLPTWEDKLC